MLDPNESPDIIQDNKARLSFSMTAKKAKLNYCIIKALYFQTDSEIFFRSDTLLILIDSF